MVSHRGQVPCLALYDDALRTAATGGDDRNPTGHRFRQDDAKSFLIRWQGKQRCLSIQLGELLDRGVLAKLDEWRNAEISSEGPVSLSRSSSPGENQPRRMRKLLSRLFVCAKEHPYVFPRIGKSRDR